MGLPSAPQKDVAIMCWIAFLTIPEFDDCLAHTGPLKASTARFRRWFDAGAGLIATHGTGLRRSLYAGAGIVVTLAAWSMSLGLG